MDTKRAAEQRKKLSKPEESGIADQHVKAIKVTPLAGVAWSDLLALPGGFRLQKEAERIAGGDFSRDSRVQIDPVSYNRKDDPTKKTTTNFRGIMTVHRPKDAVRATEITGVDFVAGPPWSDED